MWVVDPTTSNYIFVFFIYLYSTFSLASSLNPLALPLLLHQLPSFVFVLGSVDLSWWGFKASGLPGSLWTGATSVLFACAGGPVSCQVLPMWLDWPVSNLVATLLLPSRRPASLTLQLSSYCRTGLAQRRDEGCWTPFIPGLLSAASSSLPRQIARRFPDFHMAPSSSIRRIISSMLILFLLMQLILIYLCRFSYE